MIKRHTILTVILLTFSLQLFASQADTTALKPRKKVGLVLSGGGAKGIAHIGVLKVLEQAGIPVDYIAGTSMGSIIGGLYAVGYTPKEMDSLVRHQNWLELLSDKVSRENKFVAEKRSSDQYLLAFELSPSKLSLPSGLIAGQNVYNLLNDLLVGYQNMESFDDLPIPFACVSYDMTVGRDYVARSGNLPTAIRASMSIPGAFMPVKLNDMLLIDGGVSNNFPVNVVREMGAEVVIGVDLFAGLKEGDELANMMGMIDQLTTFLGRENYEHNLLDVDLYLHPDIFPYNAASFNPEAVDTLLVRGERVAREHWDELIALKEVIGIDDNFHSSPAKSHLTDSDSLRIGTISFSGLTEGEQIRVHRDLGIRDNSTISKKELQDAIKRVRGSGSFSYVTYNLENESPYDLEIIVNEKKLGEVNVGFRFDSDQMASILLGTSYSLRGGIFSPTVGLKARLGQEPYIRLNINTGRLGFARLGAWYSFRRSNFDYYNNGKRTNTATFGLHSIDAAFTDFYLRSFNLSVGAHYDFFNYRSFLYAEDNDFEVVKPQGYLNYYLSAQFETLDDLYYPNKGISLKAKYMLHTEDGFTVNDGAPFMSIAYEFKKVISPTDRLTFVPSLYGRTILGKNVSYPYLNCLGGVMEGRYMEQQMPFVGIPRIQIFDNSVMVAAVDARYRLWKRHYICAKAAFAIQHDYFLDMFFFENRLFGYGLEYSYQTPLGPITVLFSGTSKDPWAGLYFSFGKNF